MPTEPNVTVSMFEENTWPNFNESLAKKHWHFNHSLLNKAAPQKKAKAY